MQVQLCFYLHGTHTYTCSQLVAHCYTAQCVGGLDQVEERGINTRPPKRKRRRKRDRENRRWRRDRHVSSRCLVVYVIQRREWNVFWTWGSVTTGRIVTEITFSLDSRGRRERLSLLCVCVYMHSGHLSFGFGHNTNISTHVNTWSLPEELL